MDRKSAILVFERYANFDPIGLLAVLIPDEMNAVRFYLGLGLLCIGHAVSMSQGGAWRMGSVRLLAIMFEVV